MALSLNCLLSGPVVQIVGNIMALTTFRETLVHAVSVRQAMTISTLWNRHVLVSVTGCARDLAVLGLARGKRCKSRIMTRSTELRLSRCRISQTKWFVSLVTSGAVSLSHQLAVRLVAINAVRDITVGVCMAEVTGEACVHARACNHLLVRTRVAGDANHFMLTVQGDVERLMWVVAVQAGSFNFIVGASFMAITTNRDIFGRAGAMPFMTGLAINFSLVRRAICRDLSWLLTVTLDTVRYGQNSVFSNGNRAKTSNESHRKSCNQQFLHHHSPPQQKNPKDMFEYTNGT